MKEYVFELTRDCYDRELPEPVRVRVEVTDSGILLSLSHVPSVYDGDDGFSSRILVEYACPIKDRPLEEQWELMLDGDRSGVLRREGWVAFVWADGDDESPTHEIEIKPLTDLEWKGDGS